ncbi:MAG: LacI family DNA-binding transcriptional regulator [Sphingobacterium sp.]
MTKLTLRDIASALNLSVSSVSKALYDSHEISTDTKRRVMNFAKANHYFPNRMAKSLKMGKSGSIGVVICSINNSFVTQMLDGIDHACTAAGYDLIIMQSKESLSKETACMAQLEARGVEGILVSPSLQTHDFGHFKELQRSGIPVVLFDRLSDQIDTEQVGTDNFYGAYRATKHLLDNGHVRIAILNVDTTLNIASERLAGYLQALKERGITSPDSYTQSCDCSSAATIAADVTASVTHLMQSNQPPSAILTVTDQLSMQTLITFRELGSRVPQDIAIAAFSNTNIADILATPLTTIRQPAFEIGKTAAAKLIHLIRQQQRGIPHDAFERIELPTELIVRRSSLWVRNL